MRTKNARNKSKFILVKLEQLNKVFKPDAIIRISKEYSFVPHVPDHGEMQSPQVMPAEDMIDIKVS